MSRKLSKIFIRKSVQICFSWLSYVDEGVTREASCLGGWQVRQRFETLSIKPKIDLDDMKERRLCQMHQS